MRRRPGIWAIALVSGVLLGSGEAAPAPGAQPRDQIGAPVIPIKPGPGPGDIVRTPPPGPVLAYLDLLHRVLGSTGPAPIESLYAVARLAGDSLLIGTPDGRMAMIEDLDDSTYEALRREMKGFTLERNDDYEEAEADPAFFLALSRARGDAADTAFFRSVRLTRGEGGWAVYIDQQTDYSGCTKFGSGRLVFAYGVWSRFLARHPGRYLPWAREELDDVEEELVSSTCACGDSASVGREFRVFLRRFPNADVATRVRWRLHQLESGHSGIRFGCISG